MLKSCSLVLYYPARISALREGDACLGIGMNRRDLMREYSRNKNLETSKPRTVS